MSNHKQLLKCFKMLISKMKININIFGKKIWRNEYSRSSSSVSVASSLLDSSISSSSFLIFLNSSSFFDSFSSFFWINFLNLAFWDGRFFETFAFVGFFFGFSQTFLLGIFSFSSLFSSSSSNSGKSGS